jgi:D-alanine-D-alanine ligase-like ATP-grasp enzyme
VRDLQLSRDEHLYGGSKPMPPSRAMHVWLRNRRRLTDIMGVVERRRFRAVRGRFYDRLWRDAASAVGADYTVLPNGFAQISRGRLRTFVDQSDLMLDSAIASRLLLNKAVTFDWLAAKGVRVPRRRSFDVGRLDLAEAFLRESGGPVVIKPADGTGCGHGVTTLVTDREGLRVAARHAAAFHAELLVEEQLAGASYRLLYLDGEFIDAVRRDPPALTGDGCSSIRQLAAAENGRRLAADPITALSPLMIDLECRNTLSALGLSPATVLAAGDEVRVKLAVNENAAAQNHVVRDEVHPEIVEIGRRIVRDLGIGFAGLDLMATNIALPPAEGGTVFNEINAGPGIHHHYLVAQPERVANVAPRILEQLFSSRRGVIEL